MSEPTRVTAVSYRHPRRPLPVAIGNRLGRLLERLGYRGVSLGQASLLAAARRSEGLLDFGDERFQVPLRRLLAAIEEEARLHSLGRLMIRQSLLRALRSRLRIEAEIERQPEILERPVEAPIFIAGLQRTGTTMLHRLLATDAGLRPLSSWEALSPAPARGRGPVIRRSPRGDPRLRNAEMASRVLRYLSPDFFAIHPVEARAPEEDVLLLDLSFYSTTPEAIMRVPSFSRWLAGADHRHAYVEFKRAVQLLLCQRPGRWVGKTPHHLEFLDALFEVFPDARIIQTHRDPTRGVASFCSMVAHGRGIFSDSVDPLEIGRHWAAKSAHMVARAMATRDRVGEEAFLDVSYERLVADPMAEIRRVYEFLGRELTAELEDQMREWLRGNPQHKHGRHRYRLEDFGLRREEEMHRFAEYLRRFEIPRE